MTEPKMPDEPTPIDGERGLYRKYDVQRLNDPTGKHARCEYYVLDLAHDKFAADALEAYAVACKGEFPYLSTDLNTIAHKVRGRLKHDVELMANLLQDSVEFSKLRRDTQELFDRAELAERQLTSALALAAEREVEIEKWKSLYNGACNDLGASLEQHEATKQRAEAANARAIRSKHEKGS